MSRARTRAALNAQNTQKKTQREIVCSADRHVSGSTSAVRAIAGNLATMAFTNETDSIHSLFKLPDHMISGTAQVKVQFTKNTDSDISEKNVYWRLDYTAFDAVDDAAGGAGMTVIFTSSYDDSGTTTRIVYSTPTHLLTGTAGDTVALKVQALSGSNVQDEMALVGVEVSWQEYENRVTGY